MARFRGGSPEQWTYNLEFTSMAEFADAFDQAFGDTQSTNAQSTNAQSTDAQSTTDRTGRPAHP